MLRLRYGPNMLPAILARLSQLFGSTICLRRSRYPAKLCNMEHVSKRIWGFRQGRANIGRGSLGVALGCLAGVLWMVAVVLLMGRDGGNDPSTWAWIDVVCIKEHYTD